MSDYDPKSALKIFANHARAQRAVNRLTIGASKDPYEGRQKAETLCVLLASFVNGSAVLPDDFDTVEKTGKGLKAHVRPDGGVFVGAFELPHDPTSVIVVYGDPLMDGKEAVYASLSFRRLLRQQLELEEKKVLGPFATPDPPTALES